MSGMSAPSKTAVVLVSYNGWKLTRDCLDCLFATPLENCRIVVVDNASQDNTAALIREHYPQVELLCLEHNMGFGAANNRGVALCADCQTIVLLNNDTLPAPGFLPALIQKFAQARKEGSLIYAPRILNRDGTNQDSHYTDVGLLDFFTNAFRSEASANQILQGNLVPEMGSLARCDWTSAICWCMERKIWNAVGGFDERIFMYYEDVDFAWRSHQLGIRFVQDSSITLVHLGGGSAVSTLSRSLQHDNAQEYVFRKRWGLKGFWVSRLFRFVRSSMRLLAFVALGFIKPEARTRRNVHWGLLRNLFRAI